MADKLANTNNELSLDLSQLLEEAVDVANEEEFPSSQSPLNLYVSALQQQTGAKLPDALQEKVGYTPLSISYRTPDGFINAYTRTLKAIPIALDSRIYNGKTVHPRGMRPYTKSGQRDLDTDKVFACRSYDGINPISEFVGSEIYDFRTDEKVQIEYDAEVGFCTQCPFAKFEKLPNGKNKSLCEQLPRAFVYVLPFDAFYVTDGGAVKTISIEGGFGVLTSANSSTRVTILGRRSYKINGVTVDAIDGFKGLLRKTGTKTHVIPKNRWDEIVNTLSPNVIQKYSPNKDGDMEAVVNTYLIYPNGMPNEIAEVSVRLIQIGNTKVAWGNDKFSGRGYSFTILDEYASEEDYKKAMEVYLEYRAYVIDIEANVNKKMLSDALPPKDAQPALSSGESDDNSEEKTPEKGGDNNGMSL